MPSILKKYIKRYFINEKINLLGLRHIRDYRSLLDQLRKHIKLPTPPPRPLPLRLGVQTPQQSQPAAQSTKEQQQQLMTLPTYPSHIGPLSTAGQTQAITTTQNSTRCPPVQGSNTWTDLATERDCAWHPFCDQKQRECGGTKKCHCRKYGDRGTHKDSAPSDEELKVAKANAKREKQKARRQNKKNLN